MGTAILEPDVDVSHGDVDDEDGMAHIVNNEAMMLSAVEGIPATALCGYKIIQKRKADDLPICGECIALWDAGVR